MTSEIIEQLRSAGPKLTLVGSSAADQIAAPSHPEVIDLLEKVLAEANAGGVEGVFIVVAAVDADGALTNGYRRAGDPLGFATLGAIELLKQTVLDDLLDPETED